MLVRRTHKLRSCAVYPQTTLVRRRSASSIPLRFISLTPRLLCSLARIHESVSKLSLSFFRPILRTRSLATEQCIQPLLIFLRKEVIQPHLPIRLPCYDFTPVIDPAFGSSLRLVGSLTSGVTDSHGVTGGVYKTRERIHRDILIRDY